MSSNNSRLAYVSFYLLGCGILFPWNAYITAADYFEYRFPGQHMDRLFTIFYLFCNLSALLAMLRWHYKFPSRDRIVIGFTGFIALLVMPIILDFFPANILTLFLTLLIVAGSGICDGVAQGALFGDAALLPPENTHALVAGTALSGVAVSALRLLTKAAFPATLAGLRASADLYFILGAVVCVLSLIVYTAVLPPLLRQYYVQTLTSETAVTSDDTEPIFHALSSVLKQIWQLSAALVMTYIVTLSIFPGVLAEDVHSAKLGSWYPVLLITACNVADWAGKSAPMYAPLMVVDPGRIFVLSVCRFVFIPLFYVTARSGTGAAMIGFLTLALGLTNGWLTTCAMVSGPMRVGPSRAGLVGNVLVLSLIIGLCVGAGCGFLWLL